MNMLDILKKQKGMSLIEVMVAMVILAIGILAVMAMQIRATGASVKSLKLTNANNVALSLLEILKELPFDDAELNATGNLVHDANDRIFVAANFPEMQALIRVPAGAAAGTIVDPSGVEYQLSWDVQDNPNPGVPGEIIDKTIRVYMAVNSFMSGQSQVDMTSVKYRNISLNP
ncbi:MAG: prepilin-type N-terminal cleavage/methylation domain-containing protein [Desulfocapsaceae bacterium]|nr:prepilin-type N-terminal cleavage/methylation domain-containing protein [Desulfocapsaceae bacterium]